MAPQKKLFKKSWNLEALTVTLESADGNRGAFPIAAIPANLHPMLMLHGLTQKLSDATAGPAGTTLAEKWAAIMDTWEALRGGEWSMRREGAGSLLLRALCEAYPAKDRGELKAALDGWSTAERNAVSRSSRIKPILDRLQAERTTDVDADALLGELE